MFLGGVSEQMHLALAAAQDRWFVSSPAVLADGFVELGCSTSCFQFFARAVVFHFVCEGLRST